MSISTLTEPRQPTHQPARQGKDKLPTPFHPHPPQNQPQVVAAGAQDRVELVAQFAQEVVASESPVIFHVPDGRLDRRPAFHPAGQSHGNPFEPAPGQASNASARPVLTALPHFYRRNREIADDTGRLLKLKYAYSLPLS